MEDLIFFENDDYIIAKKPCGLLSEEDPSGSRNLHQLLEEYIRNKYPWKKQLICQLTNRLDKPVGGLLICAKKQSVLKELQHQFYLRKVHKFYFAIVEGKLLKKNGQLENYLLKSQTAFKAVEAKTDNAHAKLAKLSYRCLAENESYSLLSVKLHTGKFHQIRCQFSILGNPIWNDEWYGAKRVDPDFRIGLFSYYLGFIEPNSGIHKEFKCAPPQEMPWNLFSKEIEEAINSEFSKVIKN